MNPHKVITGLTALQADGLACPVCGANYLRVRVPSVPVGRSVTGSQVHACVGRCAEVATAEHRRRLARGW
ncbi:hypothetical protein GTS_57000 [Gandjariella thermophila]|uniref:Uncharacterized protein n=1 Tax=Gandjariella thermophila TaxID=1931992 RepID=A0A4D4JJH0_9PSEU|nr:hypothetical protein GTS_57000 [Gandjariella thermophila]